MSEVRADSNEDAESILSGRIEKVPNEVIEVARIDSTWMFKIDFEDSIMPSSFLGDRFPLRSAKSIRIVWNEQWMHDVPEDLESHRYRNMTRTLDAIIDPGDDVAWLSQSSLYVVGDDRKNHLCLEPACLESKGMQCPKLAAASISRQLVDRDGANDQGRTETFKNAVEHLGRVVQDTYLNHPNDTSRMTVAMVALASSDNPFRQLMRA